MMTTCDRELLSLYVSDDVTPAEREAVEAHLATCESCRQAADEYRDAALALVSTAGAITLPAVHVSSRAQARAFRTVAVAAAILAMSVAVWQVPGLAMYFKQVYHNLIPLQRTPDQLVDTSRTHPLGEVRMQPTTLAAAEERLGYHVATPTNLPPGFTYTGAFVLADAPKADLILRYEDKKNQKVIDIYYYPPRSKIRINTAEGYTREVTVGDNPGIIAYGAVTKHADGTVDFATGNSKQLIFERNGQVITLGTWEGNPGDRRAFNLVDDQALIKMAASLK